MTNRPPQEENGPTDSVDLAVFQKTLSGKRDFHYSVSRTSWAAALATFGVPVQANRQKVFQSVKSRDWDTERERRQYSYPQKHQVPAGYRDKLNTYRETVNASRLIADHAMGNLRKWAPDHLFYVMMSAGVNWDRLVKDHLPKGAAVSLFRVDNSTHYQLHLEEPPPLDDPAKAAGGLLPVVDPYLAAALCTVGYTIDHTRSECREDGKGGHCFRLWFHKIGGPRPIETMAGMLQNWRPGVESGIADVAFIQAMHAMQYLKNRIKILRRITTKPSQMIVTAPKMVQSVSPGAKNRVVQVHEGGFDKQVDGMIKYFKK